MVVQHAQSEHANGMTAGMMSTGANSGAGLPDSFADYRPAAQVPLQICSSPRGG